MTADLSADARRSAVDEAIRRATAACAESAELLEISRKLWAQTAALQRRIASRSTTARRRRDATSEPSHSRF